MPDTSPLHHRLLQAVTLDALRGFEAAARLLSFTAAADELCLTQSAVSKQVRQLEDTLGRPLFVRGARTLSLTADGRELYGGVRTALQGLGAALQAMAPTQRQSVSITAPPAFASLWLAPRLARYRELEPGADIRLDASEEQRPLDRDGFDLAVRLSTAAAAPASWTQLATEQLVLVAAPSIAERIRSAEGWSGVALLEFEHPISRHPWMKWADWSARLGWPQPDAQPRYRFSQYEHAIKAAVEGVGVAIGRRPLIDRMLSDDLLRPVLPEAPAPGLSYHLVWSAQSTDRPDARRFAAWLQASLEESLQRSA